MTATPLAGNHVSHHRLAEGKGVEDQGDVPTTGRQRCVRLTHAGGDGTLVWPQRE